MTNRRQANNSIRPWAVVFWLLVWQGGSMALSAAYPHGHLLLASPVSALVRLGELALTAAFWRTVFSSASHIFGGFLLSCALGVILAAAAAKWRLLRELLSPLVAVVKAVPVVSFIILALVWLRAESLSLVIAALMVLPVVWGNLARGIRATDPQLLEMVRAYRFSKVKVVRLVYLPSLRPYFASALTTSMGLAWKSGAAAEVLALPKWGIGTEIYHAKLAIETPDLFAWTVVVVALSLMLEWALGLCLERWKGGDSL